MTACPIGSITYNGTLCACPPGFLLNSTTNSCSLFSGSSVILTDIGLASSVSFPETIFAFDSIKKFTQSQAVFLEATLVMLLSWLVFCFCLRFVKIGDGRSIWFQIRWWISRLDVCFSTRHWLDDQKVVMKRKTELGGTFSIASWILFIGLFAAITKEEPRHQLKMAQIQQQQQQQNSNFSSMLFQVSSPRIQTTIFINKIRWEVLVASL